MTLDCLLGCSTHPRESCCSNPFARCSVTSRFLEEGHLREGQSMDGRNLLELCPAYKGQFFGSRGLNLVYAEDGVGCLRSSTRNPEHLQSFTITSSRTLCGRIETRLCDGDWLHSFSQRMVSPNRFQDGSSQESSIIDAGDRNDEILMALVIVRGDGRTVLLWAIGHLGRLGLIKTKHIGHLATVRSVRSVCFACL